MPSGVRNTSPSHPHNKLPANGPMPMISRLNSPCALARASRGQRSST